MYPPPPGLPPLAVGITNAPPYCDAVVSPPTIRPPCGGNPQGSTYPGGHNQCLLAKQKYHIHNRFSELPMGPGAPPHPPGPGSWISN